MICPFCQYEHDNEGDRYGCPNCNGEGLDGGTMALTNAERQAAFRARKKAAKLVRVDVWIPNTDKARAIIARAEKRARAGQ